MKRWLATALILATICAVSLEADVTITQTMNAEGGPVAMTGANVTSKMVTRIKGTKARVDMEMAGTAMTTLADLAARQWYLLRVENKTATLMNPASAATGAAPDLSVSLKPTGQAKTLLNVPCDGYAIDMVVHLADMAAGQQMPPDAAAMLKDVRMVITGSMWVARNGPGASEYVAFQKEAAASGILAALTGAGAKSGNMNKMFQALTSAPGIPLLSEMSMSVEGSGQMADMMKGMGPMKITTTVSSISTDPIRDDVFQVPADYTIVK